MKQIDIEISDLEVRYANLPEQQLVLRILQLKGAPIKGLIYLRVESGWSMNQVYDINRCVTKYSFIEGEINE